MIDPSVRAATPYDSEALLALAVEGRLAISESRGGQRWLDTHANPFDGRQLPDGADTLVATLDDVVVGYLVISTNTPVAAIAEIYVTAPARELGFGDELLSVAITLARQAGCTHLEAEALPGDRQTKNLYERAGIKARLITVSTPL